MNVVVRFLISALAVAQAISYKNPKQLNIKLKLFSRNHGLDVNGHSDCFESEFSLENKDTQQCVDDSLFYAVAKEPFENIKIDPLISENPTNFNEFDDDDFRKTLFNEIRDENQVFAEICNPQNSLQTDLYTNFINWNNSEECESSDLDENFNSNDTFDVYSEYDEIN